MLPDQAPPKPPPATCCCGRKRDVPWSLLCSFCLAAVLGKVKGLLLSREVGG